MFQNHVITNRRLPKEQLPTETRAPRLPNPTTISLFIIIFGMACGPLNWSNPGGSWPKVRGVGRRTTGGRIINQQVLKKRKDPGQDNWDWSRHDSSRVGGKYGPTRIFTTFFFFLFVSLRVCLWSGTVAGETGRAFVLSRFADSSVCWFSRQIPLSYLLVRVFEKVGFSFAICHSIKRMCISVEDGTLRSYSW